MTREEWNSLQYPINLRPFTKEEGGGWFASIPVLGEGAFCADGETPEEAIAELESLRRLLYDTVIEAGQPIPLPPKIADEVTLPSGKWVVRTPARLHGELQRAAEKNHVSLNTYTVSCIERGHTIASMEQAAKEILSQMRPVMDRYMRETITLAIEGDVFPLESVKHHGGGATVFVEGTRLPPTSLHA